MAHILIAEDDDSLRRFLAKALERAGHEVTSVPDGIAAEKAVDGTNFDLLIADIVMPGLDGIELARRVCEQRPELQVMFITGFAAVALKARQLVPRSDTKVLSKPFHLRDLVEEVERLLAA